MRRAMAKAVVSVLGLLAVGCVPMRHTIQPYASDPVQAQLLEVRASAECSSTRTDGALPPYGFTTDGCTFWLDSVWRECCIQHDVAYWCGGSEIARADADRRLRDCVASAGHPMASAWMYYGARLGGSPTLPFSWRWGYGWKWPYSYDPPNPATSAPAKE